MNVVKLNEKIAKLVDEYEGKNIKIKSCILRDDENEKGKNLKKHMLDGKGRAKCCDWNIDTEHNYLKTATKGVISLLNMINKQSRTDRKIKKLQNRGNTKIGYQQNAKDENINHKLMSNESKNKFTDKLKKNFYHNK